MVGFFVDGEGFEEMLSMRRIRIFEMLEVVAILIRQKAILLFYVFDFFG